MSDTSKTTVETQVQEKPVPLNAKEEAQEFFKTISFALIFALVIRMFLFEPFNIPSGSMKPTLLVGDYLLTNKSAYGYGQYSFSVFFKVYIPAPFEGRAMAKEPKRGDIAVFFLPQIGENYIKRVVGMPGEKIQVKRGRLFINEKMVPRESLGLVEENGNVLTEYIETLPGGILHRIYERGDAEPLDNTITYTVPEGHYFMMGDNRDNSRDSRVLEEVGYVPFKDFVGRADVLFFSTNGSARAYEVWKWPWAIRFKRLFNLIGPVRPDSPETQDTNTQG